MPGRSPRPHAPPRSLPHPHRDDVLIAVAGLLGGLLLWWLGLYNNRAVAEQYGPLVLVPLTLMCLAALGRRVAQPWALLLAVVALAGDLAAGSLLATVIVFTDVVYAAVLYGSPRLGRIVLPSSVVLSVAVTLGLLAAFPRPEMLLFGALCAGITITPAWTGALLRRHRDEAAAERLRAEQTALLAEMDRAQAVTAERARMARELHDVVANHLSAIAIHSTAALSLHTAPDTGGDTGGGPGASTGTAGTDMGTGGDAGSYDGDDRAAIREALGVIRENSVQGLAEMRRLIRLLRTSGGDAAADASEPAASPTLDGLDALFTRVRGTADEAGLTLVLHDERGTGPLPTPVELTAYRIVQEAVTNALKHATPGTVRVRLAREARRPGGTGPSDGLLTVCVASPLDGTPAEPEGPRAPGSGAGLVGMRERVALLGGELTAGPTATDGTDGGAAAATWRVRARLPLHERPETSARPLDSTVGATDTEGGEQQ